MLSFFLILDTSWIISGLLENYKYSFRVSALNAYGWSDPSEESTQFDLNTAAQLAEKENNLNSILIAIFIPTALMCIVAIIFLSCKSCFPLVNFEI